MNPTLANKMLKATPKHILDPKPTLNTPLPLNTGASIPALGLGTWQSRAGEVAKAVSHALLSGYTHIDCAYVYGNEKEVGEGLKEGFKAGIKREELFITTKLWCTFHSKVEENLDISLERLGLDYVDLYLMHWPVPLSKNGNNPNFPTLPDGSRDLDKSITYIDAYKSMEQLLKTGKVKAIGVANFSEIYLEELLSKTDIVPAVNQVELHPLLPQESLIQYCKEKGIHVTAYSPLGSTGAPLLKEEEILKIAKKHDVGAGTVLLSYHLARGNSSIPKSVTPSRIDENKTLISLDEDDMVALGNISKTQGVKRIVSPNWGVNLGFPDKQ
ncbi:Aldo/keto reductase [Tothia fuscella]|uniref:Aldo/keto reductase n=1 Tax=Tothia fuscella TaxID=1048955 RepID=A0A9P4NJU8_9PEZI|nr:Aldo/keto reductase [Tothia fuscella]